MSETRKVIVNGTEYEVQLEGEGTLWKATVGGKTFDIEMPEAAVAAKPKRSGGRKKKKSGTVSANKTQAVARRQRQRSAVEQRRAAEGQADIAQDEDRWRHRARLYKSKDRLATSIGAVNSVSWNRAQASGI